MKEPCFNDNSYKKYLNEERLMGSKCRQCNTLFLPPRPICIKCHSTNMTWIEMEGRGKLSAFSCITIGRPFMIEEGYNRQKPYCSGIVELNEGVRVYARIEGVDTSNTESINVGMPLRVKFLHRGEGGKLRTFLSFEPFFNQ